MTMVPGFELTLATTLLLAGLGLGSFTVALELRFWFGGTLDGVAFAEQIGRLLRASNPDRARKLCAAVPRHPVSRIVTFALALQLPRVTPPAQSSGAHYRDAPLGEAFAERVNRELDDEVRRLLSPVTRTLLLVIVGGVLVAAAGGVALAIGLPLEWERYAAYGMLGGAPLLQLHALKVQRRVVRAVRVTVETVHPFLAPADEPDAGSR